VPKARLEQESQQHCKKLVVRTSRKDIDPEVADITTTIMTSRYVFLASNFKFNVVHRRVLNTSEYLTVTEGEQQEGLQYNK
jgi:hypothetical protein